MIRLAKRLLWRLWCWAIDICPDCEQTWDGPGRHRAGRCRTRCEVIVGVDEAANEHVICDGRGRYINKLGPIDAHFCPTHHVIYLSGTHMKIRVGEIVYHSTAWEVVE